MVDIPWPHPLPPIPWRSWLPITAKRILQLAVAIGIILLALNWSAAIAESYQRCNSGLNRFLTRFGLSNDHCQCIGPRSLDFNDPCNSMYIPLL
jgi:hypothetical protein